VGSPSLLHHYAVLIRTFSTNRDSPFYHRLPFSMVAQMGTTYILVRNRLTLPSPQPESCLSDHFAEHTQRFIPVSSGSFTRCSMGTLCVIPLPTADLDV
jgi:hypothetical protein